jgi:hypothetical protein
MDEGIIKPNDSRDVSVCKNSCWHDISLQFWIKIPTFGLGLNQSESQ